MEVFNTKQRMKTAQAIIESIDKGEHNDVEIVLEDGVIKASVFCNCNFWMKYYCCYWCGIYQNILSEFNLWILITANQGWIVSYIFGIANFLKPLIYEKF